MVYLLLCLEKRKKKGSKKCSSTLFFLGCINYFPIGENLAPSSGFHMIADDKLFLILHSGTLNGINDIDASSQCLFQEKIFTDFLLLCTGVGQRECLTQVLFT